MADRLWRNRIIEQRMVDASELQPHPLNPRRHPETQKRAVAGLLGEVGIVDSLTVYESEAYGGLVVLDGHLRQEMGGQWPVNVLDVTDAEAELILATFDFSTSLAELDGAALADLLMRVEMTPVEDDGVKALLQQLATHAEQPKREVDAEPQVDRAEELRVQWGVELGQMWACGDHRIVCGDCTDAAVVARLMGGERAGCCVTDPPYGQDQIDVPHDSPDEHAALMTACVKTIPIDNGVVIAFQSPRTFPNWLAAIKEHQFRRALWLYKEAQETFPWHGWIMKSEMILVSEIGKGEWLEAHPYAHDCYKVSEVSFRTEQIASVRTHGSVKPLKVVVDLVSRVGGIVCDPFLGSGTTLIACEQLGRKCRAVEISPAYVAVALDRFYSATQIQPRLLEAECVSLA